MTKKSKPKSSFRTEVEEIYRIQEQRQKELQTEPPNNASQETDDHTKTL